MLNPETNDTTNRNETIATEFRAFCDRHELTPILFAHVVSELAGENFPRTTPERWSTGAKNMSTLAVALMRALDDPKRAWDILAKPRPRSSKPWKNPDRITTKKEKSQKNATKLQTDS